MRTLISEKKFDRLYMEDHPQKAHRKKLRKKVFLVSLQNDLKQLCIREKLSYSQVHKIMKASLITSFS